MRARKRFGQHFLKDPSVLERMTAALNPRPEDRLLEISDMIDALSEEEKRQRQDLESYIQGLQVGT